MHTKLRENYLQSKVTTYQSRTLQNLIKSTTQESEFKFLKLQQALITKIYGK